MSGHHVSSAKQLWTIGGALFLLTAITVAVAFIHIPAPFNVVVALSIAVVKATLVMLFFMNLYWDERFNTLVFLTSFVFLALMIGITLLDTLFRAEIIPAF